MLNFSNGYSQTDSLPELNKKIISFVKANIGKRVGRGECWDLAEKPLNEYNAKWDKLYEFGRKLDLKKEKILPGDIIQFQNVQIKTVEGNKTITETYLKHTAIVFEVISKEHLKIAQQNTSQKGKKVSIDNLYLEDIYKGKITIYRPVL